MTQGRDEFFRDWLHYVACGTSLGYGATARAPRRARGASGRPPGRRARSTRTARTSASDGDDGPGEPALARRRS